MYYEVETFYSENLNTHIMFTFFSDFIFIKFIGYSIPWPRSLIGYDIITYVKEPWWQGLA